MDFLHNIKGWIPDKQAPALTFYRPDMGNLRALTTVLDRKADGMPYVSQTSLRPGCSPVEDQGDLGSCTAQAGAGLIEYLQRATYGEFVNISRLYLYYVTRQLLYPEQMRKRQKIKDTGASIAHTAAALTLIGAPPEEFWPYDIKRFDVEPPALLHAMARKFEGVQPVHLKSLEEIKTYLRAGFPVECGFLVFDNIGKSGRWGQIPLPDGNTLPAGGHAILLVGYADNLGCLEVRNSWGEGWGDGGYGWLPYEYVTQGLADDFRTFLSAAYVQGVL